MRSIVSKSLPKTHHRLKTLLTDKKDLLHWLRLESKATNKLIQSIQDEAQDTMERARDILSEANRSKKDAEMLKDDIQINQNTLLGMQMGIRKQSAQLKKQAARMTQTHARRNHALLQQQKLIDHNVNTEKQQWNTTLLLMQRKMQSSIKQLQKGVESFRATTKTETSISMPTTRRIFSSAVPKPYCQYPRR